MGVTINEGTQTQVYGIENAGTQVQIVKLDIGAGSAIADFGGTILTVNSVANLVKGTVTSVEALPDPLGSVVVTAGTTNVTAFGADIPGGTTDLVTRVGNLGTMELGSAVVTSLPDLPGGTVDLVTRVSNVGTIELGSAVVTTLPNIPGGTLALVSQANVTVGTMANLPGGTVGLITRVGNLGTLELGSVVVNTLPNTPGGTLGLVTRVGNLGTIETGTITSVASLANMVKGTVTRVEGGTIGLVSQANVTVGTMTANIPGGTINRGTVQQLTTPAGSVVQSTHVLGTGGTVAGTLVAPTGAGTTLYLTGLSIVGHSGTADYAISRAVAGSAGAGVYARGLFAPGGGISRDFSTPINMGTNGTLAYFVTGNGTASFTVSYIVST